MNSTSPEFRISDAVVPDSLRFEDFAQTHLSKLDPEEHGNIEFTFKFAKAAHEGQFRKSGGPFFEHPLMIVIYYIEAGGRDSSVIKAAFLHDVPEENFRFLVAKGGKLARESHPDLIAKWEVEDEQLYIDNFLIRQFGSRPVLIIDALTRGLIDDDSKRSKQIAERIYRKQILDGPPEAGLLKGFDILHNNRTLPPTDTERIIRKINETRQGYLPIIQRATQKFPMVGGVLLMQMLVDLDSLEAKIKKPIQSPEPISFIPASA